MQRAYDNGVLGNTYIFVDLYYTAERAAVSPTPALVISAALSLPLLPPPVQTEGHNWHVHMNPPVDGEECAPTIGGHYNPFSVSLGGCCG